MDASDRIEAAQAMLDAPADEPTPETTPQDAPAANGAEAAAAAGEGSKPQGADAGESEARQRSAPHPDSGAGAAAQTAAPGEELQALLADGKRTVADVRQAVEDADAFYRALRGEAPLEGVLAFIQREFPEAHAKLQQLLAGSPPPAGAGANAATPGAGASRAPSGAPGETKTDAKARDPLAEIDGLRTQLDGAAKERQLEAARRQTVEAYDRTFGKLADQAGLEPSERDDYSDFITRSIGRDAKALERLEKGSFVDVERLFNEFHGRMLDRAKRWADKQIAAKRSRDGSLPRTPAGGSPPAAATRRVDLSSKEDRVAAATETFREA